MLGGPRTAVLACAILLAILASAVPASAAGAGEAATTASDGWMRSSPGAYDVVDGGWLGRLLGGLIPSVPGGGP